MIVSVLLISFDEILACTPAPKGRYVLRDKELTTKVFYLKRFLSEKRVAIPPNLTFASHPTISSVPLQTDVRGTGTLILTSMMTLTPES